MGLCRKFGNTAIRIMSATKMWEDKSVGYHITL